MLYKNEAILLALAGALIPSVGSSIAVGQEIRFHPVAATGNVICTPGQGPCGEAEIMLSEGGVAVTLFLEFSDWDSHEGGHPGDSSWFLGGVQGTVDSSSYQGGIAANPGTLPGFDLVPFGWDIGEGFLGAFQATKVCGNMDCVIGGLDDPDCVWDPLSDCGTNAGSTGCPLALPACVNRPDFLFNGLAHSDTVSTAVFNFTWLTSSTDCREDPRDGSKPYFGTLILKVPAGARGTYNVEFVDDTNYTVFIWCTMGITTGRRLSGAQITIATGRCCSNLGIGPPVCEDGLPQDECDTRPRPRVFTPLASCSGESVTDCNGNGVPDDCDIFTADCNDNGVPDDCDLLAGDCNDNGIPDECDAAMADCNDNGVPDECDVLVADCNDNGVPDECEPDSDGDGVIDECDGCPDDPDKTDPGPCGCGGDDSADADGDGVPDCLEQCPGNDDTIFAPDCVEAIPTLSTWGLVVMTLLLLVVGKSYLGRWTFVR